MTPRRVSTATTGRIDRMTPHDIDQLAARVRRLCPSHRDPERFHQEKSAIADELRRLAQEMAP
jgi:hypothetical protein